MRVSTWSNVIGSIQKRFEDAGLKIVACKMIQLNQKQARGFYAEHDGKPFFDALVEFMTSGPIVVQVLFVLSSQSIC